VTFAGAGLSSYAPRDPENWKQWLAENNDHALDHLVTIPHEMFCWSSRWIAHRFLRVVSSQN